MNKVKAEKWASSFLLVFALSAILFFDIKSFAQVKIIKTNYPKSIYSLAITPSLTPIQTPSLTPKLLPKPTIINNPTIIPIQTINTADYLLEKVNEYRKSLGLYEVKFDSNTCIFAAKRAQEVSSNFNHDGFKNLPYATYSIVTENIAMNQDYEDVINQWINSAVHAEIMRQDTPFVCIKSYGNYYAYEGWKP